MIRQFLKKAAKDTRGDTLVEVILATALISATIGIAVSMSNRNLQTGVSAAQRSQALALAQDQVERIKNAYLTSSSALDTYKINKPFCILADGRQEDVATSDSKCANFNGGQYSISINYGASSQVFSTTITWPSNSNTSGSDQLQLYYKLPGS